MPSRWQQTTVGEVADVFDGPHATPKKTEAGPYFLSISSLSQGLLDLSKSAHLSETDFSRWTRRVTPLAGDVLFSYETRLGEAALMPEGVRGCLGRRMGLLRPRHDVVDPRYLLLAYLGPQFQQEIRARTISGATVERIALKELPSFPLALPPLPEQRRIGAVLGALDDKIELNRQMNQTLKAMAQALFKSWFVDFDGEPASKLVESELGLIPRGWRVANLGAVFGLGYGKSLPKKRRVAGPYPVYGSGGISGTHETPLVQGPGIVVGRKGSVGTVFWATGDFFPIDTTFYVTLKEPPHWLPWVYYTLRRLDFKRLSADSAVPGVNRNAVLAQPCVVPRDDQLQRFHSVWSGLRSRITAAQRESETLAELRDTLLPKLISGELRVPEIEGLLTEAS